MLISKLTNSAQKIWLNTWSCCSAWKKWCTFQNKGMTYSVTKLRWSAWLQPFCWNPWACSHHMTGSSLQHLDLMSSNFYLLLHLKLLLASIMKMIISSKELYHITCLHKQQLYPIQKLFYYTVQMLYYLWKLCWK